MSHVQPLLNKDISKGHVESVMGGEGKREGEVLSLPKKCSTLQCL